MKRLRHEVYTNQPNLVGGSGNEDCSILCLQVGFIRVLFFGLGLALRCATFHEAGWSHKKANA